MKLESPLIPTQVGEAGFMLRSLYTVAQPTLNPYDIAPYYSETNWKNYTHYCGAGGRLGTMNENLIHLNYIKVYATDGLPVSSVVDAENLVISKATMVTEPWDALPWGLRRQAAYVACRNRRGWPNGVLMHPSMAKKLEGSDGGWVSTKIGPTIGRWTDVGLMQKCGAVYVSEDMQEDEAVLFYNGYITHSYSLYDQNDTEIIRTEGKGTDTAAIFLETESGPYLIVSESDDTYPFGIDAYVCRVKMIEKSI